MTPAYLTETEVAKILGRSRDWLRKMRPNLEREGFPTVDGLIGLTCADDLKAWIARRRKVADADHGRLTTSGAHHEIEIRGIDYGRL
jgi:hypothetical protein